MRDSDYSRRWRVVERVRFVSGEYLEGGNAVSVTPYSDDLAAYVGELAEGGVVVDALHVRDKVRASLMAPLLKLGMPDDEYDDFFNGLESNPSNSVLFDAFVQDAANGYGQIARGAVRGEVCLDSCGLQRYLSYWASVGAAIGVRRGGEVAWRDGRVLPVPPADERHWHVWRDVYDAHTVESASRCLTTRAKTLALAEMLASEGYVPPSDIEQAHGPARVPLPEWTDADVADAVKKAPRQFETMILRATMKAVMS